jgi:hypothetical protein
MELDRQPWHAVRDGEEINAATEATDVGATAF